MRAKEMPPAASMALRPEERHLYGVIATVRCQDTGRLHSIVGNGAVMKALDYICHEIDNSNGVWRIVSVSTPATIFGDLQGSRGIESGWPEVKLLGMVGRQDLVESWVVPTRIRKRDRERRERRDRAKGAL